jgi:HEAT repeat protein/beta-lactamase regulating signal transducer with metallopeptidase domain
MTNFTWLPDAAWRGALLLAIAFVFARLLKSQPAAVRHVLWTGALAGVMAMPLLAVMAPVRLPVSVLQKILDISTPGKAGNTLGSANVSTVLKREVVTRESSREVERISTLPSLEPYPTSAPLAGRPVWFQELSPVAWAGIVWMIGVLVLSARLLLGFVALARMRRRGQAADDSIDELADACAARLGLHSVPRVIISPNVAMPCAAGWLRPVILLPEEYSTWARERLEVVLLHELSHIRRMDIVPHVLSEIVRVVYWFNPLVWVAAARLRAEAERATDDRVVHAGARPSDYAAHLLEIVRQARPIWHPAPLMPLARRSEFEGRMLAILESGGKLASTRWALGTVALIAGLSLGVASMEGASANAPPKGDPALATDAAGVVPDENRAQDAPDAPRRQSAQQSGERDSAIGALADALRDPVASVRQAAAEALGGAKDSVAVRALMEVLRSDESPLVRRAAAWSLGEIGDAQAIPALADALTRDRDTEVRKNAAGALGNIDNPRATSALTTALERDAEASVRIEAAEALASIEDPGAIDALIRVLDRDDDPGVRRAVIEAIDNLESSRAVPAVSRALRDANAEVRRAAAEALGSMDDNDAVPPLMAVVRDADNEVRRAVIHALASLGDRRALAAFVGALADADVEVRRAAAEGFGNLENLRTAPPELIRAMDDRDAEVRHSVAHALGHIGDPDAVRALVAHVTDPSVEVRQAVVEAFEEFDDPAVTAALRTALKDTDPEVRQQAVKALGNRNRSK